MKLVVFIGQKSSNLPIKTGVSQGSVLQPLFCLSTLMTTPLVGNVFKMQMTLLSSQNIVEELINVELLKL